MGTVYVGIPHDQGGRDQAIDSMWRWDSTVPRGPSLNGGPSYKVVPGGNSSNDDDNDDTDGDNEDGKKSRKSSSSSGDDKKDDDKKN